MARVCVTGGRSYADRQKVFDMLDGTHGQHKSISAVIHGACPTGADNFADRWCIERGIPAERYVADWDNISREGAVIRINKYGKPYDVTAGFERNTKMMREGRIDIGLVFPGGPGTLDMMSKLIAIRPKIRVYEICKDGRILSK